MSKVKNVMKSLKNKLIETFGEKKKIKRKSARKTAKKKVAAVGGRRTRTICVFKRAAQRSLVSKHFKIRRGNFHTRV